MQNYNLLSIKTEQCNSKRHHLMINHVKSKAARCFFSPRQVGKNSEEFHLSAQFWCVCVSPPCNGDREEIVTYPCQHDGPEGYDSPVPASERLVHRAQAEASQANNSTHTQLHTTLTHTHGSTHKLNTFKALLSFSTAIIFQNTCDTTLELKPK